MIKRPIAASAVAACLVALSAAGDTDATAVVRTTTGSASAGGAVVTATLVMEPGGEAVLRVAIAPLLPGFHIYSLALPPRGIDGLGVPTRVSVKGAFTAISEPQADAATRYLQIAGLGVALPVYPDGPVTFTVRVTRHGHGLTDVVTAYGLCSDSTCMFPVAGLHIALGPL